MKTKKLAGIKAIGLDVDGTLYKMPTKLSAIMGMKVIKWAAEKLGRDEDEFAQEYLERRDNYRSNTLTLNSYGLNGEEIFQKVGDEFPLDQFLGRDEKLVILINNLKRKYQLFIITNGTGRQVEKKLKVLGLNYHDFEPRIYCYDQGWIKPEPAPFLAAIEALQLRPEAMVYVGDREDVDVEGAKSVGMKAVLVGGTSRLADQSVVDIYHLRDIFLP